MHSPKAKEEPDPLIAIRNRSLVSIAESRVTWPKNARYLGPDARNVTGPEEATSRNAPKDQRSGRPPKNPLHLGIRDPTPFRK